MTTSDQLDALARDYWESLLRRDPILATFYGDYRYNDRLPNVGPAGRALDQAEEQGTLERVRALDLSSLAPDERVTADMLRISAEDTLTRVRLRLDEMAVDQMEGPQVWVLELLNWHPLDTAEHVDELATRYRAFPAFVDQYLENLRDGVRDGRTAPRIAVERVIGQLRALLAQPLAESAIGTAAAGLEAEQGQQLLAAAEAGVYPAYQRMLTFLGGEYLERHAREDPGVWSVADGEEIYAYLAAHHTTSDLTPRELHQLGLDDLGHIQAEMRTIMARLGDGSGDIRAFTERLTRDPKNLPGSREEILASAERYLRLAYEALPRAFGSLPETPCRVAPVEEYRERETVAAFYFQPSADGSRPGTFYINTYDPSSRPKHTVPALVFHEGVPGHHLQIAIAQETEDLPAFRRLGSGMLANAYVEGWALYTERLADELGLYPDDLARFGMLGYQAWRACRLVVDTGLHALRWSRQQALDFFFENVGLTERETVNEVDRYIVWPGQALSYKVGQREIEALRREAEQRLGQRFDRRAFHDEVLRHGAVPLSTLRLAVRDWLKTQEPAGAPGAAR